MQALFCVSRGYFLGDSGLMARADVSTSRIRACRSSIKMASKKIQFQALSACGGLSLLRSVAFR
jgi:hypothetical protein